MVDARQGAAPSEGRALAARLGWCKVDEEHLPWLARQLDAADAPTRWARPFLLQQALFLLLMFVAVDLVVGAVAASVVTVGLALARPEVGWRRRRRAILRRHGLDERGELLRRPGWLARTSPATYLAVQVVLAVVVVILFAAVVVWARAG